MSQPDYEVCKSSFLALVAKYENKERNEATTRLAIINDFISCLGWDMTEDCTAEDLLVKDKHSKDYADYVMKCPQRSLVIEAKREGTTFELPLGNTKREYKLKTLCTDVENLDEAIAQVTTYAQERGIPLAAVTNGHQIVAFIAIRIDGIAPKDGKAVVFETLEEMQEHFRELWDMLSKPAVQQQALHKRLIGKDTVHLPPKLSSLIHRYPDVKKRDPYQANLQILSDIIIEDLATSEDLEQQFLEECYCQSGALSQYALISREILKARYAALFTQKKGNTPPTVVPARTKKDKKGVSEELLAESLSRRPIILVGDVGAGKTAFIRYLINISAADEFREAITLYIDLGSKAILTGSVAEGILDLLPHEITKTCKINIEDRTFVSSVYFIDLDQFDKRSIFADLKGVNDTLFLEKRIDFLAARIANRQEHLKRCLLYISKNQKKQIVIFLDNVDQRDYETQQAAFLVAQDMAANWPATVYTALRPETFNRSMKEGALSAYHPKAFSIAPPRIDEVIKRRLTFARRMTGGQIAIPTLGTDLKLGTLDTALKVFLDTIEGDSDIMECVDNISGGNVRRALDLVRDFFGSGHVELQRVVDLFMQGRRPKIHLHEFIRAAIYGDAKFYDPDESPVANIFDLSSADAKEHFLTAFLVSILERHAPSESIGEVGFVPLSVIFEKLQVLGFIPDQIEACVRRCIGSRLLEVPGRVPMKAQDPLPESVRITSVSLYHIRKLATKFEYLDAVVVDTPILDALCRQEIRNVEDLDHRLKRAYKFLAYLNRSFEGLSKYKNLYDWEALGKEAHAHLDHIKSLLS